MFKTILAAVDGSGDGDLVAQKAGELAALCDARLVIAYVADPGAANDDLEALATAEHLEAPEPGGAHPGIARVPGWFDDALSNVGRGQSMRQVLNTLGGQILERAAFKARRSGAQTVAPVLEEGDPASRLLEVAARESADLIVLGTRGLGQIKEILLGSTSHKVVMMARCPCLVVK